MSHSLPHAVITRLFAGATSIALLASPANAQENEPTVTDKNAKVEQAQKAVWKPSPPMPFDAKKISIGADAYVSEQSRQHPSLLVTASDKRTLIAALNQALEIQKSLKAAYGYEVKIWVDKTDTPNVSSIKPFYNGASFINGKKSAVRTPQDAFKERMAFGSFCEKQDQKKLEASLMTLVP